MGLRKWLLTLEQRFAWGIVGFVSGTLLSIVGLYVALHERRPSIEVQVVNQFDILDVRRPLQDLSIFFEGSDIQRNNQNLRTLHVQFVNNGEADLLQTHYDQRVPWGLELHGGRVLKVQLLNASSPYIRANLNPRLTSDTTIGLDKIILERGRRFTLDLLILHSKAVQPKLEVLGKIAGMDRIVVRISSPSEENSSSFSRALSGSAWTQIIRLPIYFVAGVLILIAVIASSVGISSLLKNRSRKRRTLEIRSILETSSPEDVLA